MKDVARHGYLQMSCASESSSGVALPWIGNVRWVEYQEDKKMKLRSQEVRTLAPENDPLKMGMGWKVEDLGKPQIMVESTFGDSHPGSAHLDQFVKQAVQAVNENGGRNP